MGSFRLSKLCRYLFIGVIFPFIVQYGFYFRFTPNYNPGVLSKEGFLKCYSNGIYRFRVVGIQLQLWVYDQISANKQVQELQDSRNRKYDARFSAIDPHVDNVFYFTYFLISTCFSILSTIFLLLIFDLNSLFQQSTTTKVLISCLVSFFIGFTQFVVTPYDTISYFLFNLAFFLFLKYLESRSGLYYGLLCAVIAVATLNRESALVILSFMTAIYLFHYSITDVTWMRKMIWPTLSFLVPYIALRVYFAGQTMVTEGQKYSVNFNPSKVNSFIGILFICLLIYIGIVTTEKSNRKLIRNFLLAASPYILAIPLIGRMIELRLWVPVILSFVVLDLLRPAVLVRCLSRFDSEAKERA